MTTRRIMNRWLAGNVAIPGIVLTGTMCLVTPARAQLDPARASHPQVEQSQDKAITPRPPPALPGSKPNEDTVIPSDRAAADMAPNEALFDAINRGDVGAAKDALNRGADLEARNVLGQTPLDLSIDIGRNDISFLLLSMRADAGRSGVSHGGLRPGASPPSAVAQTPTRPPVRAPREAASAGAARVVPPQAPQLFAGNGGAPVPQAGFLGFSSARTP